ncbi:ABC transporter permease [Piscinibacter terrae]|uniref:ABC transporter permease n=1 Tax=Piscinibacter terrae TaxID=2496871 RepID=A0A3N7HNQ9_9BURK|nr:FtsX-like permease family protein [Albitalea terrae]RQP23784.1 ABC transporter permease [Albitalea terrae]
MRAKVALARKTLVHEWRRFAPATLSVAFSALLLLVQTALVLGIFGSAAVFIDRSGGDLWIGAPGTQSVELGRPLPADTDTWLRMHPQVRSLEPFLWVDADWRSGTGRGAVSVSVSGIATKAGSVMFSRSISDDMRARLAEPEGVIVERADLAKLGVDTGSRVQLNGHSVRVVGIATGLRALGGVNVLASVDTARRILGSPPSDERNTYFVATLREPAKAVQVRAQLDADGQRHGYQAWTRAEFSRLAIFYWMFETGAGLGVLFLSCIVCVVGIVITSQSLMGAVGGSVNEYATLHALGVGMGSLKRVVLEQSAWVGAAGLLMGIAATAAALWLASRNDVPVSLDGWAAFACIVVVMGISLLSGLAATRVLRRADPATLLR